MFFNIQCLYLAKAFGDEFTLNTDADEFVVFHNNASIAHNLKYKYYDRIKDKCWVVFDSYRVWKLTNPNASSLVQRYTEIDASGSALTQLCKTMWNNKYLWSVEVHSGGACHRPNTFGFNWKIKVQNYKNWFRGSSAPNAVQL
eukprot:953705_1